MRILRDHVLKEFSGPLVLSLLLFMSGLLMGRGLVQMADLVFNRNVNVVHILKILGYSSPFILTFAIPMAVLTTTLLTFGRLSHDNEIMAMRASGVSVLRLLAPLAAFIVVICLASFLLSDRIAASAHYTYRKLLTQIGVDSPQAALEEGTFIKKFKGLVIFIYEVDRNKLRGVRIYQPQEGRPTRTIIAQRGELLSVPEKNLVRIRLMHGTSDEPDPKDPSKLYKLNFRTYDLPLDLSGAANEAMLDKKPKDMSVRELKEEIRSLEASGIQGAHELEAEIQYKIALSLSSLAFLLIGVPLGIRARRSEKSVSFGIGLAVLTLYWVLLIGGKAVAQKGWVPAVLALEAANLLVGGAGAVLLARLAGR
ncbi:MAG: hypothetical protein A3C53_05480 [Omnitrophica WOR_2 bacterium RIFCSPHIGHO2_02_FULL_68_15]|nr:MAG: hypothetical protein A3C53_05480 [Omnitrophica WOR_2 bacterium RIFCSPHIGHO2_02_FULL_68_15]